MVHTRFLKDNRGFTLIEVLIAIAIFSIGLLAVGLLQANSLMKTGDVARKTEAWTLVEEQATLLKALPFYNEVWPTPPANHPADLVDLGGAFHTANRLDNRYTVHWLVEDDTPIASSQDPSRAVLPIFAKVPNNDYTVCKRVTVVATRQGDDPVTDALAQVQFIKTWATTGIP